METKNIILLSGVEAVITPLTGLQQKILTRNNNLPFPEKCNEMLATCVKRVGNNYAPDPLFFSTMLAGDRRKLLFELRMFSMDEDPLFIFDFEYEDKGQKFKKSLEIRLEHEDTQGTTVDGLPETKYYNYLEGQNYPIDKDITITLPKSGQQLKFTMLDGQGELIGSRIKEGDISTNSPLEMRKPVIFVQTEKALIPVKADIDTMALKDIEHFRSEIKRHEGKLDSEIIIKHPVTNKDVIIDILQQKAFFFPSQAI